MSKVFIAEKNIKRKLNLVDQDLIYGGRYNPLYDLFKNEFDKAFRDSSEVNFDYVLDHYYVDSRDEKSDNNDAICDFFSNKLNINKSNDLVEDVSKIGGKVFLLIGKKGIGKTTLIRYYERRILESINAGNKNKLIFIYLDLKDKKSDKSFINNLPNSLMNEFKIYLSNKNSGISRYLFDPKLMREINPLYNSLNDEQLAIHFLQNSDKTLDELFRYLKNTGYQLILAIDNIDDFSIPIVKILLDKCQNMKSDYGAKCIIAVRDYWNPRNLNIDDSKISALTLTRPNIMEIIDRRLNAINEAMEAKPISEGIELIYGNKPIILTCKDIIETFKIIGDELTSLPNEIFNELFQLSNYDVRDFLENIYYFFHSPYLYSRPNFNDALIKKIKEKDPDFSMGPQRKTKFFDYLTGFMTPHSLFYDFVNSNIFNIFYHDYDYSEGYNYKNTLIFIRILQTAPELGYPKIKKEKLVNKIKELGYKDEHAIIDATNKLLLQGLLESPDGRDYIDVSEINLSAKGKLYLHKLIYEFSYLLFICDRVPIPESLIIDKKHKFGDEAIPLSRGDLDLKIESVRNFLMSLELDEHREFNSCPRSTKFLLKEKKSLDLTKNISKDIENSIIKMKRTYGTRRVKKITSVRKVNMG